MQVAKTDGYQTPHDIIADLLSSALLAPGREDRARELYKHGMVENLYCWERAAVEWLADNWKNESISMWTARCVRRFREVHRADAT